VLNLQYVPVRPIVINSNLSSIIINFMPWMRKKAQGLIENGFDYVTDMDDLKLFRKIK